MTLTMVYLKSTGEVINKFPPNVVTPDGISVHNAILSVLERDGGSIDDYGVYKLSDENCFLEIMDAYSIKILFDEEGNPTGYEVLKSQSEYKQEQESLLYTTVEGINSLVREKIAKKYDLKQEIQMLNKGLVESVDTEYLAYKQYRQECIDWGNSLKSKL